MSFIIKYLFMWVFIFGVDLILGDYNSVSQGDDRKFYSVFFIRTGICLIYYFLLVLWCYRRELLPKLFICIIFSTLLGIDLSYNPTLTLWLNRNIKHILNAILPYHSDSIGWMSIVNIYITISFIVVDIFLPKTESTDTTSNTPHP